MNMTARLWTGMRAAVDALLAEIAAGRILKRQSATTLRLRPSGIDVMKASSGRTDILFMASGRPTHAIHAAAEELATGLDRECTLEFARGLAIVNEITLPAESHDIIRAIVQNKVEGIAPWPLTQSVFGHRVTAIAGDPAHVSVDVAVVSRALLEEVTMQLARAGISVTAVQVRLTDEDALRVDFLANRHVRHARQRAGRLAAGLAVISTLVAAYGLFLVWTSATELARDRQKTAALLESLRDRSGVQGGTPLLAAANGLHQRRRDRQPAVAVLNELTSLLPQNVWLESLTLEDDHMELKGQGTDIPSLIAILEGSDTFKDVNFASATQLNAELTAEAFSIDATLERTAAGEDRTP